MSQNRQKTTASSAAFEMHFYRVLIAILCMCLLSLAFTANAASTSTKISKNPTYILKTGLDNLADWDTAHISSLSPNAELRFNLPAHDWYESLELFISAYPQGKVSKDAAIFISYNGAAPVPLQPRGHSFDAHIRLDPSMIRTNGNVITFSVRGSSHTRCLSAGGGEWVIDFKNSKLVSRARAKNRSMQIADFVTRMAHPMTAPRSVRIKASGPNALALEALSAQAISLRTPNLPAFNARGTRPDLELVYARFDQLGAYNKGLRPIAPTSGPLIMVDNSTNNRLIFTAADDDGVLALARAFAKHEIPGARRARLSIFELYTRPELKPLDTVPVGTNINEGFKTIVFKPSWLPTPQSMRFNVKNAATSSGEVILDVRSSRALSPQSKLRVFLNEQSIGYTLLDKTKKQVSFDIPPGLLKATNNELTFKPALLANAEQSTCLKAPIAPLVNIGQRSRIVLSAVQKLSMSDLNRFASSGEPFHQNTTVVLTASAERDKSAGLQMLGYAARAFGPVLASANYASAPVSASDQNLLFIGPNVFADQTLLGKAPIAVKSAMNGKSLSAAGASKARKPDYHASTDAALAFEMAARRLSAPTRVGDGGIAAIYGSPYTSGRFVGVITASKPDKFAAASRTLMNAPFWNALSGSVVRWNSEDMLSAQAAIKMPGMTPMRLKSARGQLPLYTRFDGWMSDRVESAANAFRNRTSNSNRKAAQPSIVKARPKPGLARAKTPQKAALKLPDLRGASQDFTAVFGPVKSGSVRGRTAAAFSQANLRAKMNKAQHFFDKKFAGLKQTANRWKRKTSFSDWVPRWFKTIGSVHAVLLLMVAMATILILLVASPKQHSYR